MPELFLMVLLGKIKASDPVTCIVHGSYLLRIVDYHAIYACLCFDFMCKQLKLNQELIWDKIWIRSGIKYGSDPGLIWIKSRMKYRKIRDEMWINPFSPQINPWRFIHTCTLYLYPP
ncbi:hypothetical protein C1646_663871 [Rhizophagus diaphanus]|nr:hypothetical protein C1646_663871 [Rhizophagus diaphanus] [Rhizophagus sp. MUCL 43196]